MEYWYNNLHWSTKVESLCSRNFGLWVINLKGQVFNPLEQNYNRSSKIMENTITYAL